MDAAHVMPSALTGIAWRKVVDAVLNPRPDATVDAAVADQARRQAPVLWLLGKVQAGKTSVIRAVTGAHDAEIGAGFKPCTRHSRRFDFPPEVPLVRFLDTRGLGEVAYDPRDDLEALEGSSHALVVVARAMDPAQEAILDVVRAVRRRRPDWSVVLVQTRLHDGYPDGRDHPDPETFAHAPELQDLRRSLKAQEQAFRDAAGGRAFRAVTVDLTPPEEGFHDPLFGLDALLDALDEAVSAGRSTLMRDLARHERGARLARAHPHLLGYATAAGLSDLVPLAGLVTVPTLQGKMLHSLARLYDLAWTRRNLTTFFASLGSGAALGIGASFAARQVAKLIPIYGQTAGAAAAGTASAVVTYAIGRAACQYLEQQRSGRFDPAEVARTYRGALKEAHELFRRQTDATAVASIGAHDGQPRE